MITNKDEVKAITKHISCDCKCKFNSTTCNSKPKWKNKTFQCECKNFPKCEKYYRLDPSTGISENSKCLKSVIDTSVTRCHKSVIVMNNLSTNKTNTITTNDATTALINCHSKKVRDCYILHTVLLVTITLLITVSICCYLIKYPARHL